ncbi:hypothetical protein HPB51_000879 [Rhipicephalus microplus]|uniref:Uncharacterized protein n=1 Tax=Rhipicephalus microplus TaxID=6941 RepID=A0A9J6DKN9_RHIMP|nr:hypothetical protein HPB51_000879 [Rhipicephalus microplus]
MATSISPPPPFLETPGTPAIPWHRWFWLFLNFVLASGANEWPATRRRALLLHCLGPKGQRIFDALPAPPPPQPPLSTKAMSFSEGGGTTRASLFLPRRWVNMELLQVEQGSCTGHPASPSHPNARCSRSPSTAFKPVTCAL